MMTVFSSISQEEYEIQKALLKLNNDEMAQWVNDFKSAFLNAFHSASADKAVKTMQVGLKTISKLNKMTENTLTTDFDMKKIEEITTQNFQKTGSVLFKYIKESDMTYPQLREKLKNADINPSN